MKHLIEKFQYALDQLFLFLVRWSLVVARGKMPVRQLANRNCQFITIVVNAKISHLGMRSRKACDWFLPFMQAKPPVGKA